MAKNFSELLDIIKATDEDAADELLKLMQPEKYDRDEMGSILEATIGTDLTSFYDKQDIEKYIAYIEERDDIDDDVINFIKDNRDTVVDDCYEAYNDLQRATAIHLAVDSYLQAMTGCDITAVIGDDDLDLLVDDEEIEEEFNIDDDED